MKRLLSTLLVMVVLVACGSQPELSPVEVARGQWESSGVVDYAMTYGWSCECTEQSAGPFRVTVSDGVITSFVHVRGVPLSAESQALTVTDLFHKVEAGLAQYGADTEFAFDDVLGYPVHISLGVSHQPVDGGESLRVTEFTVSG